MVSGLLHVGQTGASSRLNVLFELLRFRFQMLGNSIAESVTYWTPEWGWICGDAWEQQCVDNGYRAVDFTGGQPEREDCAGEYKLRSRLKLHAELHSHESPENRLLSNKAPRRKAGSPIIH